MSCHGVMLIVESRSFSLSVKTTGEDHIAVLADSNNSCGICPFSIHHHFANMSFLYSRASNCVEGEALPV